MSKATATSYRERASYQAFLLGAFAMAAAALLVMGNIATKDAIEQRRSEDLLASLEQVISPGLYDNDPLAHPLRLDLESGNTVTVYRALRGHDVAGVAYTVSSKGYAGPIELILGLDPRGEILGVRVLAHTETPGLGDKIEADRDDWILGFDGLSLGNPAPERWAVKKDGGAFDQFSGATITPRAVVRAIKGGLELFREQQDTLLASAVIQETPTDRGESAPGQDPVREQEQERQR